MQVWVMALEMLKCLCRGLKCVTYISYMHWTLKWHCSVPEMLCPLVYVWLNRINWVMAPDYVKTDHLGFG